MPALLGANSASAQAKVIKIGHVSPRTGPLAGFGEADTFILEQVRGILGKGLQSGGKTYKVEIVSKDSQSSGSRAAEVASELILRDKVDLLVTSGTPDTTNPVSDQAEVNEMPCVATNCPWQPYFFGRKGDPAKGFNWTYLFFWGLEDVIAAFLALWDGAPTNKVVGGLFPNDADGNAWGDQGARPAAGAGRRRLQAARSRPLPGDEQRLLLADRGVQVGRRRDRHRQHDPAGLRHVLVAGGAAGLQAEDRHHRQGAAVSLGDQLARRARQRAHHRKSGGRRTIRSSRASPARAASSSPRPMTTATKRPWSQPIGFQHALFEVAIDVLKRAKAIEPKAILDSIVATNYQSIVGPVQWTGKPVKNVTKTPLVAGQWQRKGDKFELVITANKPAPNIPTGGKMELLS